MRRRMKGPFFAYWLKREVEIMKSEFEETSSLMEAMLDDVKEEQQTRLQTIRETGPWNQDWETAVRQQRQLAQQVIRRHMILDAEAVEQRFLHYRPLTHHQPDLRLPADY